MKMTGRAMWRAVIVVAVLIALAGCGPAVTPERAADKPAPPPVAPPTIFNVGEAVQIGDFQFTVNKVRTQTKGAFFQPAEGHIWVIVECTVENLHGTKAQAVSSMIQFSLVDRVGRSQNQVIGANTRGQLDGELGGGRRMTGEIAWEVPVGTKGLELVFKPSLLQPGQAIFQLGDL